MPSFIIQFAIHSVFPLTLVELLCELLGIIEAGKLEAEESYYDICKYLIEQKTFEFESGSMCEHFDNSKGIRNLVSDVSKAYYVRLCFVVKRSNERKFHYVL